MCAFVALTYVVDTLFEVYFIYCSYMQFSLSKFLFLFLGGLKELTIYFKSNNELKNEINII